jgi:FAD/FMN-containing dehydrogenase
VDENNCRIDHLGPLPVVRPASVAEVGDTVRRAAAEGQAIYPLGGRTLLDLGLPPDRPGWALDQVKRVLVASHEILEECVRVGGSVTGEHGIGVEKIDFMPRLFTPEDLNTMLRLRTAFNPEGRCSPCKMLPTAGACIEPSKAGRRAAL